MKQETTSMNVGFVLLYQIHTISDIKKCSYHGLHSGRISVHVFYSSCTTLENDFQTNLQIENFALNEFNTLNHLKFRELNLFRNRLPKHKIKIVKFNIYSANILFHGRIIIDFLRFLKKYIIFKFRSDIGHYMNKTYTYDSPQYCLIESEHYPAGDKSII